MFCILHISRTYPLDCYDYWSTFGANKQPRYILQKHLPGGQLPPPIFFFFFWCIFLGFFYLQLMEDIKDGKEEVLDDVVMEHIVGGAPVVVTV